MAVFSGLKRGTASGILLEEYEDAKVHSQINENIPFLSQIESQAFAQEEGNKFNWNLEIRFSNAESDSDEMDDTPPPENTQNQFANANYTEYRRSIQLSGRVMKTRGTIVKPLFYEVKNAVRAARLHHERAIFLPKSNLLATVSTATAATATTVTVDTSQYIRNGQAVDLLLSANGQVGSGVLAAKVTEVKVNSDGTSKLTIDKNIGVPGDIDGNYGLFPQNSYLKSIWGLPDIVSNINPTVGGNFGGIDRSVTTEWQAQQLDAANQTLTASLMWALVNAIEIASGKTPDFFVVHHDVHLDLMKRAVNDKRFSGAGGNIQTLDPWGRTVHIGDIPVMRSRFCQKDICYAISKDTFLLAHPPDMATGEWVTSGVGDGTQMQRISKKIAWEAVWWRIWQLINTQCNANGKIINVKNDPKGTA